MFPIEVSAPGKLFLIGEYAVLDGAPALLTAVDRRVTVRVEPAGDAAWRISAPNLGVDDLALCIDGSLPAGLDEAVRARLGVFDAVRASVAEVAAPASTPLAIRIDSGDFARDGHKLGLGSSAAVAAALTQALVIAGGCAPLSPARLTELAVAGHRRAQRGAGSGGDVAAAVYGGVISYTRAQTPRLLNWPLSLAGMAVVTGHGAGTTDLVARVREFAARDPTSYAADIERLARLAERASERLTRSDDFLALADAYHQALTTLDRHADAGIVTARHRTLHQLAARYGAVFKSSGAGGGDAGLLFAHAGEQVQYVVRAFEAAGAHILPLVFTAPGLILATRSQRLR